MMLFRLWTYRQLPLDSMGLEVSTHYDIDQMVAMQSANNAYIVCVRHDSNLKRTITSDQYVSSRL